MRFSYVFLLFSVILLNSCSGSYWQQEPVGYDPDPSALKKSPCACLEVEMVDELPDFLFNSFEA